MPAAGASILLVDDEPDILTALSGYLAGALPGVHVEVAIGGAAAVASIAQRPFDLVLCDFKMPGKDGLEVLNVARDTTPEAARILMTAFPDMDLAIRALNEGRIQHFFTKPLEPDMVRDVVKALLDERLATKARKSALARSLQEMQRRARRPS